MKKFEISFIRLNQRVRRKNFFHVGKWENSSRFDIPSLVAGILTLKCIDEMVKTISCHCCFNHAQIMFLDLFLVQYNLDSRDLRQCNSADGTGFAY